MIERNHHLCSMNDTFCTNFKFLFREGDQTLLKSSNLQFLINDELDITKRLEAYVKEVSSIQVMDSTHLLTPTPKKESEPPLLIEPEDTEALTSMKMFEDIQLDVDELKSAKKNRHRAFSTLIKHDVLDCDFFDEEYDIMYRSSGSLL